MLTETLSDSQLTGLLVGYVEIIHHVYSQLILPDSCITHVHVAGKLSSPHGLPGPINVNTNYPPSGGGEDKDYYRLNNNFYQENFFANLDTAGENFIHQVFLSCKMNFIIRTFTKTFTHNRYG